jgi:hypothetical protein
MTVTLLPPLPYAEWEPTKTTLQLWCQIVGKLRLRYTAHRNHWWNVTLIPTARGLSTIRMHAGDADFEAELDFIDHQLVLRTNRAHAPAIVMLEDGLSVAHFYRTVFDALRGFDIDAKILAKPYGMPTTTPFAQDEEHRSYDRVAVRRWFEVLVWTTSVFEEFAREFVGKQSPVHLFWHSFDLAMSRFSGRPAAAPPNDDPVEREAYSHEVIAFGFWPGDPNTPAPTYYTYTAPEPADLTRAALAPQGAAWYPSGSGHLGGLPYEVVRNAADPKAALLEFLHSGYAAGVRTAGWDAALLASPFRS